MSLCGNKFKYMNINIYTYIYTLIFILKSAYINPHENPHMRPHTAYAVCSDLSHA